MFTSVQRQRHSEQAAALDLTPLIDVVFILLLFFLVTTSFVKDTGIEVNRPQASLGHALDTDAVRVGIAASGGVYVDGRRYDLPALRELIATTVTHAPDVGVVVIPDERVPAGRLIAVMDSAKRAGASNVAIATRRPGSL